MRRWCGHAKGPVRCGPGPLVCGSPGWTRTNNLPVNSRLLCQLSYRGMVISAGPRWRCATIAKQPPGSENGAAGASRGWQIAVGAGPEDGFPPLRPALGASAEADLLLEVGQRRGGLLAHARVAARARRGPARPARRARRRRGPAGSRPAPCAAPRGRRAGRAPRRPAPARAAVSGSRRGLPEEPLRRPLAVDPGDGEQECLVATRTRHRPGATGGSSATSPAGLTAYRRWLLATTVAPLASSRPRRAASRRAPGSMAARDVVRAPSGGAARRRPAHQLARSRRVASSRWRFCRSELRARASAGSLCGSCGHPPHGRTWRRRSAG